jgi:hypothetical protein
MTWRRIQSRVQRDAPRLAKFAVSLREPLPAELMALSPPEWPPFMRALAFARAYHRLVGTAAATTAASVGPIVSSKADASWDLMPLRQPGPATAALRRDAADAAGQARGRVSRAVRGGGQVAAGAQRHGVYEALVEGSRAKAFTTVTWLP